MSRNKLDREETQEEGHDGEQKKDDNKYVNVPLSYTYRRLKQKQKWLYQLCVRQHPTREQCDL